MKTIAVLNRNFKLAEWGNILLTMLFFTSVSSMCLALNPSRTYKQLPEKYNMSYEAHDVKTSDGTILKAWYFPASTKTTKLVLVSHDGEGNMADNLRRVDQFTSAGYNVVTYDYRGFGESSEFEMDVNMFIYPHFQEDVIAMIDFCREQFSETFDMYGWGMGAGLSLGIGWNRTEVKKIIADTPFLSMEDLEERFSDWDEPMEVPFAGFEKKYEPIFALDAAPSISVGGTKKVMLIIGSNDILFNTEDMERLKTKQSKSIDGAVYVVENPDRLDNFMVNKEEYAKKMMEFLQKE